MRPLEADLKGQPGTGTARYGGHTLICLQACLNVCLLGSGFQLLYQKIYQATWRLLEDDPGGQLGTDMEVKL